MGTYNECKTLLQDIPQRSQIHIGFVTWMEKQLMVAQSLGVSAIGMPICSDILESLYGVVKIHGTGEIKNANRIALRFVYLLIAVSYPMMQQRWSWAYRQNSNRKSKKIILFNSAASEGVTESWYNHRFYYR